MTYGQVQPQDSLAWVGPNTHSQMKTYVVRIWHTVACWMIKNVLAYEKLAALHIPYLEGMTATRTITAAASYSCCFIFLHLQGTRIQLWDCLDVNQQKWSIV
jgi:hypothetical protein